MTKHTNNTRITYHRGFPQVYSPQTCQPLQADGWILLSVFNDTSLNMELIHSVEWDGKKVMNGRERERERERILKEMVNLFSIITRSSVKMLRKTTKGSIKTASRNLTEIRNGYLPHISLQYYTNLIGLSDSRVRVTLQLTVGQSVSQSVSQPASQSLSQCQSVSQSVSQPASQSARGRVCHVIMT
jgi:hypothetical protein